MLRLRNLSNQYKRRTLRALYAQTQAYPYACFLDKTDTTANANQSTVTGSWGSYIHPGAVMVKEAGENVRLARLNTARPFGLAGQFYGGDLDDLGDRNEFGVWRGPSSVFEVLAPAFTTANSLATLAAAEDGAVANEVYLESNGFGQLVATSGGGATGAAGNVARLIEFLSTNAINVELLV